MRSPPPPSERRVARLVAPLVGVIFGGLPLFAMNAHAEKKPPSQPDAQFLEEITVTLNYTLGRPNHLKFTPDGRTLLYLKASRTDAKADLYAYDVKTSTERRLLGADDLLEGGQEKLSAAEKAMRERKRIKTKGFTSFSLSADGQRVVLKLSGKVWFYDLDSQLAALVDTPKGVLLDPRLSPDGRRLAFVLDDNLYVMRLGDMPKKAPKKGPRRLTGKLKALTKGGTAVQPYAQAEFVAQEEMSRYRGYWWSPDSKRIAYQANDYRDLERFTIADAAAPESNALTFPYPRPGQANAKVDLFVVKVDGRDRTEVKWNQKRYPYLARVAWTGRGPLSILVQARDQKSQVFLRADLDTGRTIKLHEEDDEVWLNLTNRTPHWLPDGESYLWATEAAGHWRLEQHVPRRSNRGGLKSIKVIVNEDAGYADLLHVDADGGWVWFAGGPQPVERHLYRVPLEGGAPQQISSAPGRYDAVFAARSTPFAVTERRLDRLPRSMVYDAAELGDEPKNLPQATAHELPIDAASPSKMPGTELVPPDKAGGFHGLIIRPKDLDPKTKYPVVLYVYGGPHHQTVRADATLYFLHQWIADHGFVVVCLDGRGTPSRGRDFERAIYGKFGAIPLEDQVTGLNAMAKHYPELDLDRVGVYGWSFGGYMAALSVLKRPDIFKVAVSGAPVTDWMYYDTHYTERYLGVPQDKRDAAYEASSLIPLAPDLSRPLLLIHGIADDNVYFAHTLKLTDALFRAGKSFELLPLVGLTHQVADPNIRRVLYERIVQFLGNALW